MRFDLSAISEGTPDPTPKVGDIYPARGGHPTVAWVVVGVTNSGVHLLGIDREGIVCSTSSCGHHALLDRLRIGFCAEITTTRKSTQRKAERRDKYRRQGR